MSGGLFGGRDRDAPLGGVYIGRVAKIDGATAYVVIPRLAPGFEYPARYPAQPRPTVNTGGHSHSIPDGSTGNAGDHGHQQPASIVVGDTVAVAFLEGGRDELVVLVRLA